MDLSPLRLQCSLRYRANSLSQKRVRLARHLASGFEGRRDKNDAGHAVRKKSCYPLLVSLQMMVPPKSLLACSPSSHMIKIEVTPSVAESQGIKFGK